MEYDRDKERPYKSLETRNMPPAYQDIGKGYHLEIEKVNRETKQEGKAVPWIRLFCKSNGKCGV